MILNPSCSELVVRISIRNEDEAIDVIKELMKSTGEKLVIEVDGWPTTYLLQEKIENGITTLVISKIPSTTSPADMPDVPYIRFDLEVPMDLIRVENGYLILDEKINDTVFEKIHAFIEDVEDPRKREERTFTNVKIDFSNLGLLNLLINDIGLFFYRKDSHFAYDENLKTKGAIEFFNSDLEWSAFPAYKKILTDLSKKYKIKVLTEDAGRIEHLDEWCKYNFLDFLLQRDRFTDEKTPLVGTIYIYSSNQEEFKEVLSQLEKINFSVVQSYWHDKRKEVKKINPKDLPNFKVFDPFKFVMFKPWKHVNVVKEDEGINQFQLAIVPSEIDLSELKEGKREQKFSNYLQIGLGPLPGSQIPVFYIYQEERHFPGEDYTKLEELLRKTATKVITVGELNKSEAI
jgi:hypothetical protein